MSMLLVTRIRYNWPTHTALPASLLDHLRRASHARQHPGGQYDDRLGASSLITGEDAKVGRLLQLHLLHDLRCQPSRKSLDFETALQ